MIVQRYKALTDTSRARVMWPAAKMRGEKMSGVRGKKEEPSDISHPPSALFWRVQCGVQQEVAAVACA